MTYAAGSLVAARGREWVVLPDSTDDFLVLRPLGGTEEDVAGVLPLVEEVRPASFPPPTAQDLGDQVSARMLRSALQIGFRSSGGPFRSLASIAVEPRAYQLVPLLMAMRQDVVRLLIADDVGIGKTVEAGLVAGELLALGEARGLTVLCSPALAEQWQRELREKFGLEAELVLAATTRRLERELIGNESIFEHFPVTVVSTDFIKSARRRYEFLRTCPDLVIVDEAHTCVTGGGPSGTARTQRYDLVKSLAEDKDRHLILATATPHSGDDETFRNLIGLLDPRLHDLSLDDVADRRLLAQYFVQRRRGDIRRYLDENTPFPKDRETKEVPYTLSREYADLFTKVLEYAREMVRRDDGTLAQRVNWWSALALLRALASSPRAAAHTLATRSAPAGAQTVAEANAVGEAIVLDRADDEALEAADATPGADAGSAEDAAHRRRLDGFRKAALALEGKPDHKLAQVTAVVKQMLADGYQPIVFCRFIDTAEYVSQHLSKALKNTAVECVTGTLPSVERADRIDRMGQVRGPKVLVATDCLSEGVNLQDQFQAVIHYDLAWNPTRHEQREGRVDRFGQTRDVVRAVTIYGQDNKIDGIVLEVLLRKHEAIRKTTGVSVPVPDNSEAVVEALMEGLLLRGVDHVQDMLDIEFAQKRERLDQEWESAAAAERAAVTKYAQLGIHPQEVQRELEEVRASLGTRAQVREFVHESLTDLRSVVNPVEHGFTATLPPLPIGLKDALPPGRNDPLTFVRDFPVERGDAVLHRTDKSVEAVATYVLESALDPAVPPQERPARRCAVVRTDAVSQRTTLLLVRYRFHLTLPSRVGERRLVAEELATMAYAGAASKAAWLDQHAVDRLLEARATGNVPREQATTFLARAIDGLPEISPHLDEQGDALKDRLIASHRRVREAAGEIRRGLQVRVERPGDLLGLYVFVPKVGA